MYNHYIKIVASEPSANTDASVTTYIGLGGNLGDAKSAIIQAIEMLRDEPIMHLAARSAFYRTEAVGGSPGQPDYVNAVARYQTSLPPESVLARCLDVERRLGRIRRERWGPRTIDLDVLLYGDRVTAQPGLSVPHERLRERLFALAPLSDVAPREMPLPPDGKLLCDVIAEALMQVNMPMEQYKESARIF